MSQVAAPLFPGREDDLRKAGAGGIEGRVAFKGNFNEWCSNCRRAPGKAWAYCGGQGYPGPATGIQFIKISPMPA